MSLSDLPTALLDSIVSFMDDPQTICRLETTCQLFAGIIRESKCWDVLHRRRWTTSTKEKPVYTKSDYQRRHGMDQQAVRCIQTLVQETNERDVVVQATTEVMSFGRDGLDICWKVWQQHKEENNNDNDGHGDDTDDSPSGKSEALVAQCLMRSVHCSVVFQDIYGLCNHLIEEEDGSLATTGKELEEYVITSSRMFFDMTGGPQDTTSVWIRQQLDDIADQVQSRLPQSAAAAQTHNNNSTLDDDAVSTMEKVEALNTVLFDELQFGGNTDDYYDFKNSLLHVTLQRRTGIPMTLAVLYKCVARRIGLYVDIIGLPGHIVIGLPELNAYVDVFRKGRRLLTVADCERIVNSYGHHMVPEYIQPLTPAQVFRRVLNNFGNCLAQTFPPETSKRMAVEGMRAVLINPTDEQIVDVRRWFSTILWGGSTVILREMSRW